MNKKYFLLFILFFIKNLVFCTDKDNIQNKLEKLEKKLDFIYYNMSLQVETKNEKELESLLEIKNIVIKIDKNTQKSKFEKILYYLDLLFSKKAFIGAGILIAIATYYGLIKIECLAKTFVWILEKSVYLGYLIIKYLCILGFGVTKHFAKKTLQNITKLKFDYLAERSAGYKGDFYNWLVLYDKPTAMINSLYI